MANDDRKPPPPRAPRPAAPPRPAGKTLIAGTPPPPAKPSSAAKPAAPPRPVAPPRPAAKPAAVPKPAAIPKPATAAKPAAPPTPVAPQIPPPVAASPVEASRSSMVDVPSLDELLTAAPQTAPEVPEPQESIQEDASVSASPEPGIEPGIEEALEQELGIDELLDDELLDDDEDLFAAPEPEPEPAAPAIDPALAFELERAARLDPKDLAKDPEYGKIGGGTSRATKVGLVLGALAVALIATWGVYTQRRAAQEAELIEAIGKIHDRDQLLGALRDALPQISSPDLKVRLLQNIGHFRDELAVPAIINELDNGGIVRRQAAAALVQIGRPAADPAKAKLLEVLPKTDARDRAQVVWALAVLDAREASDEILEAFRTGLISRIEGYDPRVVANALGVERLSSDELIMHEEASVRVLTAHSLAEAGDAAVVEPLIRLLESEIARGEDKRNAEVLRSAAAGLGRTADARAAGPLFRALESGAGNRRELLDALSQSVAGPALAELLKRATSDRDRRDLTRLVAETHDARVADTLAEMLDDKDEETREIALYGLAEINDPRAQPRLLEIAHGDDHAEARRALEALRLIATKDAVPSLLKLLKDRPGRRADTMAALGATGEASAARALIAEIDSDDSEVASMALASIGDDTAYRRLREIAPRPRDLQLGATNFNERRSANDKIIRKRRGAIRALGIAGRPEAIPLLMRIVEDGEDDYELRTFAAESIGQLAGESEMREVLNKLSGNEISRASKGYYIQALWQKAQPTLNDSLLNLIGSNEPTELRRAAAIAVGYAADPANTTRLLNLLANDRTAPQAALALSMSGDEEATRRLMERLEASTDLREIVSDAYTSRDIRWFDTLTKNMFEDGSIYRRLRTANQLRRGDGNRSYGFAHAKILERLKRPGVGPNGTHPRYVREQLWEALNGDDAEVRMIVASTLLEMKERGLLLRARDEGGVGGDAAREVLDLIRLPD